MSEAKIIFNLDCINITIQCFKEDKIKDICQKFATIIERNINSLLFLYDEKIINMELRFEEQANLMDMKRNEMYVIVCKKEKENKHDDFFWHYYGGIMEMKKINDIILSNNKIKETINGIKSKIENIKKHPDNDDISIELKNINFLLNSFNEEINKNNKKLKILLKENKVINS